MTIEEKEQRYFDIEEANEMILWLNHIFASVSKLRLRPETTQNDIEDLLNQVTHEGIEIVDVELGIVNFYAWDEDEEVVLSWQYGETEIHFWHEPFEDFCHRRPLRQITAEAPKEGPAIH